MSLRIPYEIPEETMTTAEVSAIAKATTKTVREWCKAGRLRHWKINSRIVIDADSVRELFEKSEQ